MSTIETEHLLLYIVATFLLAAVVVFVVGVLIIFFEVFEQWKD
jgi:hypothetical protein